MGHVTRKSILYEVTGKVGAVVVFKSNGQNLIRGRSKARKKTKYQKPDKQKDSFKTVIAFFRLHTKKIFKQGYQLKKSEKMTPFNAAISYHKLNAVIELDGAYSMDLTKLKFSKPIQLTEGAWHAELIRINDQKVQANWELNPCPLKTTQLNDKVIVIFYHQKCNIFMMNEALRDQLSCTQQLLKAMKGGEVFCWMFLTSADGKLVSQTQFLGSV